MSDLIKKLVTIQQELNAPKNQRNSFGGYNYRSCEDILGAVKPLLNGLALIITDDIVQIGNRYYIKATAKLTDGTSEIINTAYAREPEIKKGMDESQITGTASSYARKYALNGLLAIDDTKDADTDEYGKQTAAKAATQPRTASKNIQAARAATATTPHVTKMVDEDGLDQAPELADYDAADNAVCKVHVNEDGTPVTMQHHSNANGEWWSHRLSNGTYCNGRATKYNGVKG